MRNGFSIPGMAEKRISVKLTTLIPLSTLSLLFSHSPALPPAVQTEYVGEDVTEAADPTRQEEEEQEAQQQEALQGEDEEEEEEEED